MGLLRPKSLPEATALSYESPFHSQASAASHTRISTHTSVPPGYGTITTCEVMYPARGPVPNGTGEPTGAKLSGVKPR